MGYLRDVKNAVREVAREATGSGRGSLTAGQTTRIALGRAALTLKGSGDQGRCVNGRAHCGTCPNCVDPQEA